MKIVIIGPAYPWRGGIAHHTGLLARHLSVRNDVRIITFSRQYPSFLFPGKTQFEEGAEEPSVPAEKLIDSLNPVSWVRVGLRIRSMSPDLLIVPYSLPFFGPCFGTIAAIVRRTKATRVLFLCHNIIPHERRPGDSLFTRYAFAFADFFIVQSESVRRELLKLKPRAVHEMVHHPVYEMFDRSYDLPEARRILGISGERIMLFFGYVRPYKGLPVLLHAMSLLDGVRLLVVGEFYEKEETYREMIRQLHIEDRVLIVNRYVQGEEVPKYFCAADVVVVPYLAATQSGIIQTAYHFDKPVIATRVGGLSEVVDDGVTGHVIPPGDPEALAGAVRRFYDQREGERMPGAVREFKKKFGWDSMVQAIDRLARRS